MEEPVPAVIPVFPLTGCLLLPGNFLPLNIYERRYRAMVEDALAGEGYLGMIQPRIPMQDSIGVPDAVHHPHVPLYDVGCVGRIERWEAHGGRWLVVLRGLSRFRIVEEVRGHRGYRRVRAGYGEFEADRGELAHELDPSRLLAAVKRSNEEYGLEFDLELIRDLPGPLLLNGLAAALPFTPAEKQALLEAESLARREEMLLELMGVGLEDLGVDELYSPPTIH